ncbi:lysoplasmalogenase [Paenibacillus cremeus]|uniref:Lysoplasmalogenase n=1 Tax=Paenibacillus cremeus TaxID=2163881 RepID=A0A559JZS2_9BACL|nr:lysoplasmalogenase [Paenibacillus cremeus]TVY05378.1 lysoplasmalogenase [Paenibacillus cremeus]
MKRYGLPALITLLGLLYIFAIPTDPEWLKLLFKLLPMWLIIAYAYMQIPSGSRTRTHTMVLVGLFFCMLGDGLLRWFVIGLSAFLIGHLFYTVGFWSRRQLTTGRLLTLLPIVIYGSYMGSQLVQSLVQHGEQGLIAPVLGYIVVISLMVWSAILTGRPLAIVGSLLFLTSDSILSWNMFVSNVAYSGPLIMLTYYAAQFCIAASLHTLGHEIASGV